VTVTPELIVEAAAAIADTDGIDALSLSRVAADLGVTQPAMYNHVRGADDVLRRLALLARRLLVQRLRDAAVGRACDDAVIAMANAWRSFVREHPGLYAATDRHPLAGYEDLEAAVADILSVLQQVVAGYGLTPDDVEHGALSLRSALHGFVVLEAEEGHPGTVDLDESFSRLVRLVCAGLREMACQSGQPPSI
jgi:AcrR family transcriptional regulator